MRAYVKLQLFLVTIVALLLAPGAQVSSAASGDQPDPPRIQLQGTTFNPGLGTKPDIPPGLLVSEYATNQTGYYIVQFHGPVQQAWKDSVAAQGAELLDYLPDFAFKVRMNPAQAKRVSELEEVAWVGIFQPAYKLSPDLKKEGTNVFRVRVERGVDPSHATALIAQTGAKILTREDGILTVVADWSQVEAIARVLDVAAVENFLMLQKHNEYGAGVIMGANAANARGYDGSGQIVAIADTGLGDGTPGGAHPDIPAARIEAIYDWPSTSSPTCYTAYPDGARDSSTGHGTHVAVSVVGDGDDLTGKGRAAASGATLVFQAVEDYLDMLSICSLLYQDGYYLNGVPSDLYPLYQQAYNAGARVHSNSWGSDANGDYNLMSANTDDFIWRNPDLFITFSAGNSGKDANADGVIDNDSIAAPATAKNVLTVGASQNDRDGDYACDTWLTYPSHDPYQPDMTCAGMGGNQVDYLGTAGERWGFPAEPIASGVVAGDAEKMAPFSSRGPTDDGRIKPDVVAPGAWVLSGYSPVYQEQYGDGSTNQSGAYQSDGWGMPPNRYYKYFGGTSMSNPLTAGAAAVVRDFYQQAYNHNASAALVKATLINSAVDMLDENNDGSYDNDMPIPNLHEGWGRVNLNNATDGSHQFVDEAQGLNTDRTASYSFDVAPGMDFKVTLVWSDYRSTETALVNLVNDLDLVVKAPDGTTYQGNRFAGGWSVTGGAPDRVNNVENVYVHAAAGGVWTVDVKGYNVPVGPQPFALVVDTNSGEPVDLPPTVSINTPLPNSTVAGIVNIIASASDNNGVDRVEFFVDGSSIGAGAQDSGGWSVSWETRGVPEGSHTISATATDTAGQTTNSSITVDVNNIEGLPTVAITFPASGSTVSSIVAIKADAADEEGIAQVEFFVDNASIGAGTQGLDGWSVSWDTHAVDNGQHTISAVATDTSGQNAADSIGITVNNVDAPPTVSITAPSPDSTVSGVVNITADANDDVAVTRVTFLVDNTAIGFDESAGDGWAVQWDTSSYEDGTQHMITAEATDSANQTAASEAVSVIVQTTPASTIMHVGDLDGQTKARGRRYDVTITAQVEDELHGVISGATVQGIFGGDVGGYGACITDGSGRCSMTKHNVSGLYGLVSFTLQNVTHDLYTYDFMANHDAEGDSVSGTVIFVSRPSSKSAKGTVSSAELGDGGAVFLPSISR